MKSSALKEAANFHLNVLTLKDCRTYIVIVMFLLGADEADLSQIHLT